MRRTIIIAALALLGLPASAQAVSLHSYAVRDAGTRIVHKITICAGTQWYYSVRMTLEDEDRVDVQTWNSDWDERTSSSTRAGTTRGCESRSLESAGCATPAGGSSGAARRLASTAARSKTR